MLGSSAVSRWWAKSSAATTAADLALLRRVRRISQDLGVNLEGIEIILRLSARIEMLQQEVAQYQRIAEKAAEGQKRSNDTLDQLGTKEHEL